MNTSTQLRNAAFKVAFAFVVFNIAMGYWSHCLPTRKKVAEVRSESKANVVLIGNSLLDGRVDQASFTQTAISHGKTLVSVNAALGASNPPDQYLLYRLAMRMSQPRAIVVGFFDFQLTHKEPADVGELRGSRALAFDPDIPTADVRAVYHFSPLDQIKYSVFRVCPSLAYRSNAWEYVEKLRRKLAALGMPSAGANNELGRVADFSMLESSSVSQFDAEAEGFVARPEHLNQPNQLMLEQAKARGIPVIFLLMPISPYHRETFYQEPAWSAYIQALRLLVASQGGILVDGSAWFPDEDQFSDRLHLKLMQAGPLGSKIATVVSSDLSALSK